MGAVTFPRDYQAEARALRAKFFPAPANVVSIDRLGPPRAKAVVFPGRVYGPFSIADEFAFVSTETSRGMAKQVIRETAAKHGLMVEHIIGRRRDMRVVAARQEAMARVYLACPHLSMVQIAKMFHRDHTTTLHAVKKLGVWRGQAQ